jgi:hypothetical protein
MTDATTDFHAMLEADARRRAIGDSALYPVAAVPAEHSGSWEVRFRLVNTFPRYTRPLFASLRSALAPYGYTLSPLHPGYNLHHPLMQTELARLVPADPVRYAPLVFELEPLGSSVRIYVRQFGGRAAPDFAERRIDLNEPLDLPGLEAILKDYVRCMIEAPHAAVVA